MPNFKLTDEQERVVEYAKTGKDMKIIAFAGAGKTATLKYVAEALSDKKIMYLAFNKVIAKEAEGKMPSNVVCKTFHSCAYSEMPDWIKQRIQKNTALNYSKLMEIVSSHKYNEVIKIYIDSQSSTTKYRLKYDDNLRKNYYTYRVTPRDSIRLVNKGLSYFYKSLDDDPGVEHALKAWIDMIGPDFARQPDTAKWVALVLDGMKKILARNMDQRFDDKINSSHDFYLKYWQLQKPQLDVDVILFDEAQDADAVMLEMMKNQKAQVIYVGDPHQQIYEWRGAKNALAQVDAHACYLTKSFRFGREIAAYADVVLRFLGESNQISGVKEKDHVWATDLPAMEMMKDIPKVDAILVRTNAAVMSMAIQLTEKGKPFSIEIDVAEIRKKLADLKTIIDGGYETKQREEYIEKYKEYVKLAKKTKAESPRANLEPAKTPKVESPFYVENGIHDLADLEIYTEDNPGCMEVSMFYNWIKKHGQLRLHEILNNSTSGLKQEGAIKISTIHKAKGAEWDSVLLADDVICKMISTQKSKDKEATEEDYVLLATPEEYRLLYVALTRAKQNLYIPNNVNITMQLIARNKLEDVKKHNYGF